MKAVVYHQYGPADVLALREVDTPAIGDHDVLVAVRAAAANPADWHTMRGEPYVMRLGFGLRAPKENGLGMDLAGVVQAVGTAVTRFVPGDEVYGLGKGSFAELAVAPEENLCKKPHNLDFAAAAAVPLAALTALQGLRDTAGLQAGERVLIVGASGGVGTFAVQLAKLMGAHVTGVCSTPNLASVAALGADHVIDYTREDFTEGAARYDVIFQLGGTSSPARCRRALTPKGRLVLSSGDSEGRWIGPIDRLLYAAMLSPFVSQTLTSVFAKASRPDLEDVTALIEAGKLRPVIDRTLPLSETAAAVRYVETGHARGKVVITV